MQALKKKTWRPKLNAQSREGPGSYNDKLISDKQSYKTSQEGPNKQSYLKFLTNKVECRLPKYL